MRTYLTLLRNNPDFARIWLAQVVSLLGDWFNTITLMALVVAYSPDNPGLAVSGFLLARFVPPMLISPIAGVLIDRLNRKRLLVWANYLRALVVLGFLLATRGPEWLPLVYALSVAQFTLSAIFEPGQQAITPSLVKRDDLITANTLISVTWSVMLAAGAVVGGVFGALLGANAALLFDAFTYIVAGLLAAGVTSYHYEKSTRQTENGQAVERKVTFGDGIRYLRGNPDAASALLIKFGSSLGNVDTMLAIFATKLFVLGEGGTISLGILHSAFGVGAVLGPLLLNRFNNGQVKRMRWLVVVGFVWVAFGWLALTWAETLFAVCIGLLIRAMGGSANWTYSTVIIQKSTDDAFLGRVSSLDWALFYLATVLSTTVHGGLIDALGEENIRTVAVLTFGVGLTVLVIWFTITRALERRQVVTAAAPAAPGD